MDATCAIQASIHVFSLVRKYVSRILGTYQVMCNIRDIFLNLKVYTLLQFSNMFLDHRSK